MNEGYLQKRQDGRFQLEDAAGNYLTYFTSGDPIEVFDEDEEVWTSGIVEYNHSWENYCLCTDYHGPLKLYNGDKVRCK